MKKLRLPALLALGAAMLLSHCSPQSVLAPAQPKRLPSELCFVDTVAPRVRVDLKYAGADNFTGRPVAGYTGHRAVLRRDAADALRTASDILAEQGYALLIWDAYRPAMALKDLYYWSFTDDDSTRAEFYPRLTKRGIYENHYIGTVSEHTWGIAVDVTLVRLSDGTEVDMGTRHDFLDERAATASPLITPQQRANREILHRAMRQAGFHNYSKEWWHYYLADKGYCHQYNFPLDDTLQQGQDPRKR